VAKRQDEIVAAVLIEIAPCQRTLGQDEAAEVVEPAKGLARPELGLEGGGCLGAQGRTGRLCPCIIDECQKDERSS
jgi:hypothetical protein